MTHDRPILDSMMLDDLYRLMHYVTVHENEMEENKHHANRQGDTYMEAHYESRAEQCRCLLSEIRWYISKAERCLL